jgi:hypothetical protein
MGGKRYPESLKERAFRIYYDTGSLSEVVRVLKKEFKGISKSTISKWALEADARGKNWYERRSEIQAKNHEHVDEQIAGDRKKLLQESAKFNDRLLSQLPALEAKTLEGATFAKIALSKFMLEQSGTDRNSEQTAKNAINAFMLALKEDSEIAAILDRKWPSIEERFYNHLERLEKADRKKKK